MDCGMTQSRTVTNVLVAAMSSKSYKSPFEFMIKL